MNKDYDKAFNRISDIVNNISGIKNSKSKENDNKKTKIKENIKIQDEDREENKNDINIIPSENSKRFFENDSLGLININKDKIHIKKQKSENNNKLKITKKLDLLSQNDINRKNSRSINKSSFVSMNEEDKINDNKNSILEYKKKFKIKTISNESYLKQILGNRYRDQDDEFISYAERKIMKTIKDYNANLLKMSKMKLRFRKKMEKQ